LFDISFNKKKKKSLINDSEIEIQEQALSLLRNLASSKGDQAERDIGNIFQGIGDQLIPLLESKLESSHNDTIEQTLYVIVNLATGSEQHKQTIMNSKKILSKIREFMVLFSFFHFFIFSSSF